MPHICANGNEGVTFYLCTALLVVAADRIVVIETSNLPEGVDADQRDACLAADLGVMEPAPQTLQNYIGVDEYKTCQMHCFVSNVSSSRNLSCMALYAISIC